MSHTLLLLSQHIIQRREKAALAHTLPLPLPPLLPLPLSLPLRKRICLVTLQLHWAGQASQ